MLGKKLFVCVVLLTIVALALTSCDGGGGAAGDVYRVAILDDMTTTNLWNLLGPGSSAYNFVVQVQYYPTLYDLSYVNWTFVPSLATSLPEPLAQEGDNWVVTIPIKSGLEWSDGSPITADDVVFTIQTALDFRLGGNWQGSYDWDYLDHAEAIDANTVKLVYHTKPGLAVHEFGALQGPIASKAYWEPLMADALTALEAVVDPDSEDYLDELTEAQNVLYAIAEGAPEEEEAAEGEEAEAIEAAEATEEVEAVVAPGEPTGGAYQFSEWYPGAFTENVKNDNYFLTGISVAEYDNGAYVETGGDADFSAYGEASGEAELSYTFGPYFDSVVYSVYEQDAAVLALLANEVDYIYNPVGYGPGLEAQLKGDANVGVTTNPQNGFRYLAFNFLSPPLDDVAVRRALDCMINKDFLSENLLQGAVIPTYTAVPEENAFWYNSDVTLYCAGYTEQERLEWAVDTLKDAGYSWDVEPAWNEDRGGSVEWGEGLKMPDGEYVEELTMLAPSAGYDPLRATTGVFIEQWANQLGIPLQANLTNFNNILAETLGGGGNFDAVVIGWGLTPFPDHLCLFWETGSVPFNFMNYSSSTLDDICVDFKNASTLDEAREYVIQLQEVLATELPYIYVWRNPVIDAYRADNVQYPFTELLDGLQGEYGLQDVVSAQ